MTKSQNTECFVTINYGCEDTDILRIIEEYLLHCIEKNIGIG